VRYGEVHARDRYRHVRSRGEWELRREDTLNSSQQKHLTTSRGSGRELSNGRWKEVRVELGIYRFSRVQSPNTPSLNPSRSREPGVRLHQHRRGIDTDSNSNSIELELRYVAHSHLHPIDGPSWANTLPDGYKSSQLPCGPPV
jgi:hypothetical protein